MKVAGGVMSRTLAAENASQNASYCKRHEDTPRQAVKLIAVGPDAGGLSWPQRDSVGGVSVDRWDADEQERGERDEAATAGD
jgi:hypothetical protein